MPRFILLFVLFISAAGLSAQSRKQIKELKIKSMTETTVLYKDGKESASFKSEYKTFDKEGNTLTSIDYNQDGTVHRKVVSKYTGKDKTEEITENGPGKDEDDDAPKKYKKVTWKYNAKGDKTEEVEYEASGAIAKKTVFAYNTSGDRTSEIVYDAAGKVIKKTLYTYDSKGLRTEKKIYGPGDVMTKHVKYTYTY
jgi:hypothetical protein